MLTTLMQKATKFSLLCCLIAGFNMAYAANKTATDFMYVMHSNQGEIKVLDKAAGTYQLKINPVGGEVYYFSSRPKHLVGHIPMQKFMAIWNDKKDKDSFENENPNAAITSLSSDNQSKEVNGIAIIKAPTYVAKNNEFFIEVKKLQGSLEATQLKNVSLFIDDGRCPFGFGCG